MKTVILHAAWIFALAVALALGVERFGFNPTDQGFVLAQSWRILHGEVPHLDVISARPLGSAYLHIVDLLIPGPLFLVSIVITTVQMIVITVVLASWTVNRPVGDWTPARTAIVAAAALINIHLFPLNAWHTIDGIFLTACGWCVLDVGLRTDRTVLYRFGLFILGFASITKQSFVPAVLVGFVVLCAHPAVRQRLRPSRLMPDTGILVAAPLIYLLGVTAAGGLGDLYSQLTGGVAAVGRRFIEPNVPTAVLTLGAIFVVAVLVTAAMKGASSRSAPWVSALLAAIATASLVLVVAHGRLERAGTWGIVLFWMLAVCVVVDGLLNRRIPWRPAALLLLAWMASLSWGYDSPTLLAGSMTLAALDLLATNSVFPKILARPRLGVAPVAAVTVLGLTAGFLVVEQARSPYRDRPRDELVAGLGAAIPDMRGIVSTPSTLAYLEQIRACVESHPADSVAVLPDNPFVYPVLGLRNPFPMDWMLPIELIADSRMRIAGVADRLQESGSYLVLFATVTPEQLANAAAVPDAVSPSTPIPDPTGVLTDVRSRLRGQEVVCGSFIGIWAPPTVTS